MGKKKNLYIGNGYNPNGELMFLLAHQQPYTDDGKRRMAEILESGGEEIHPSTLRDVEQALGLLPDDRTATSKLTSA